MTFEEKTISTEMLYKGKIINLRRDKVTSVNGVSEREIVEHNGGTCCVALTADNKVVLVKQYRKPFDEVCVEIPAGKLEVEDTNPLEGIKRELKEETGYTAEKWEFLTAMRPSVGYTTETLYIYLARDLTPGETDLDDNEAIDIKYVDFDRSIEMIKSGEINDAKTIIGLLLARDLINK